MKNLKQHILEKLKISNKPGYTLRNFVEWYINEKPGGTLTVNDIRSLDFNRSPSKTWHRFDMSSTNIAKFLLNYLDEYIDLTEDINKEEKSITYTFYIDDILFVVLAVYNTRTTYPAFFDQYVKESLVSEKLKITNKKDFDFTWEEFIKALYYYDDGSFWFEDLITNREFIKLPETEVLNTKYRVIFVQIDDVYFDKKQVEIGLRQSPFAITVKMIAHNFDELLQYINYDKINEIYDIFVNNETH
jgi:hypothetical protein